MQAIGSVCKPKDPAISEEEWQIRLDLAACYRLIALHQWDDGILTHISARVPGAEDCFLLNPFGLMFEEVTASNLVKIDTEGNKREDSPYDVNKAGFVIHSAVHLARPDAGCVIHLHSRDGVAVSAMADGILPLDQTSIILHAQMAYHEFEGPALRFDERVRLQQDLGQKDLMLLRNHGTLAVGATVGEAFMRMFTLEKACTTQVRALAGSRLHLPSAAAIQESVGLAGDGKFMTDYYRVAWAAFLRKIDRLDPGYKQ